MKNMKKMKTLLLPVVLITNIYATEINNVSEAINIAGKQRMFTQRMVKDYSMIGMNNSFGNPKKDLINITASFDEALKELLKYNKDKLTEESLNKVQVLWTPIKSELEKSPSKEKAPQLQKDLETLLKECNTATVLFSKQTKESSGEIINISGRQRMLSQRMAGLYMFKAWGINDSQFSKKMDNSMKLFKDSLNKLKAYENNTPEINKYLISSGKSFMFFEIMNKSSSKFIPSLIYKKSMDILKNMNNATIAYTKIKEAK